jgi:SpoVK/Ycf46/Vps4 family AAA+-type ATPase
MDGVEEANDVVIIAATNRPDFIDASFLRPGRFDALIYIPPPDAEARRSILSMYTKSMNVVEEQQGWLERLVTKTSRYTGADLRALCMKAGLNALMKNKDAKVLHSFHIVSHHHHPSKSCHFHNLGGFVLLCPQGVREADFLAALEGFSPTVTMSMEHQYKEFAKQR